jgi:hypothetical protein
VARLSPLIWNQGLPGFHKRIQSIDPPIDDYLPILKYGTHLPASTRVPIVSPTPPPVLLSQSSQRVSVVDFDIPFGSVLKIMFKWMAAAFVVFCCFLPEIIVIWLIIGTVVAALIGGAMSSLHHP